MIVQMENTTTVIKILSYNIHKGFSTGKRSFVLSSIKEAIHLVQADIVFLQEVLGRHSAYEKNIEGWPSVSQFEYIADQSWPHFSYGKNAVYNNGHHGNAILSKFPIIATENLDVSAHPFEQRGLLHAVVQIEGSVRPLHLLCVHFGLFEKSRKYQLNYLCERVINTIPQNEPLIIAGDFNDRKQSASVLLETSLGVQESFKLFNGSHPRTFPSWFPLLPLDRVYGRGVVVNQAQVLKGKPWNKLSDHAALYVEVSILH